MTDLSPTTAGFLHGNTTNNAHHHLQQQQQQQQHHNNHHHHNRHHQQHLQRQHSHTSLTMIHRQSSSHSVHGSRRGSGGIRAPPTGTGRLFSYFGNEHEHDHERKKSETSFFNLGFRRKSTVVYYAPTE
ncbi:GH17267 [Drosophila grimshawi]|uniref:GH17267 n=2 Tax=Drosophila grimshawi TaxID=7222 RepID=B4JUD5_DROGR|nr:GH17267 [Drosophila grimshawi]